MKIAESKKEREKVLGHYRELAAEKKEFAEKVDRRVSQQPDMHITTNTILFLCSERFLLYKEMTLLDNVSNKINYYTQLLQQFSRSSSQYQKAKKTLVFRSNKRKRYLLMKKHLPRLRMPQECQIYRWERERERERERELMIGLSAIVI